MIAQAHAIVGTILTRCQTKLALIAGVAEPQWALTVEIVCTRGAAIRTRTVAHITGRTGLRRIVVTRTRSVAGVREVTRGPRATLVDTNCTARPELT